MAKVTIIFEDREGSDDGMFIDFQSDPAFPDTLEEGTVAQRWAMKILDSILDQTSDITVISDDENQILDKNKAH